jgi:hypothetical protein
MNKRTEIGQVGETVTIRTPSKAEVTRDAVTSIVDGVLADASKSMASLRKALDSVETLTLENAAHIKGELQEHVELSIRVLEESERVTALVEQLQRQQERRLRRSAE